MRRLTVIVALAVLVGVAVFAHSDNTATKSYQNYETKYITASDIVNANVNRQVYDICNDSRQHLNGWTEEQCAEAQDATNTEFICQQRNMLPDNKCNVETK